MRPSIDLAPRVHVVVTTRDDGDQRPAAYRPDGDRVDKSSFMDNRALQSSITGMPWSFVRQVHEHTIVTVDQVVGPLMTPADGLMTSHTDVALAMLGADCSLIALASNEGVIAAAHAGWRGLLDGVLEAAVQAMRDLGATTITAAIGPTIGPECYAFSAGDLEPLTARYGEALRVTRDDGSVALDLVGGVHAALREAGVVSISQIGGCTACAGSAYSWRARHDEQRHALVVWREGGAR